MISEKKKRNLILLDIDGTIIDEKYHTNSEISHIIKKSQALGYSLGLNSNRALEDTIPIYEKLGLDGPLILENGIYCKETLNSTDMVLLKKARKLQKYLITLLRNFAEGVEGGNAKVFVLDTTKYINNLNGDVSKSEIDILLNKFRKYTGSVHIYSNGTPDNTAALQLHSYLESNLDKNLLITKPNNVANITIQPKESSKAAGIKYLRETFPNRHEHIFMIGDSVSDAETMPFVNGFYAVGNSDVETKKKATYVARSPHTRGVGEILQFIIRNS